MIVYLDTILVRSSKSITEWFVRFWIFLFDKKPIECLDLIISKKMDSIKIAVSR